MDFESFSHNLGVLEKAKSQDLSNEFIVSGIVCRFAIQFEQSLTLLRDCLRYEGFLVDGMATTREILKKAYSYYGFMDEDAWLGMLDDSEFAEKRDDASRIEAIAIRVVERYIDELANMLDSLARKYRAAEFQ